MTLKAGQKGGNTLRVYLNAQKAGQKGGNEGEGTKVPPLRADFYGR